MHAIQIRSTSSRSYATSGPSSATIGASTPTRCGLRSPATGLLQLGGEQATRALTLELRDRLHRAPLAVDVVVGARERSADEPRADLLDRRDDLLLVHHLELAGEVDRRAGEAAVEATGHRADRVERHGIGLGIVRRRLRERDRAVAA